MLGRKRVLATQHGARKQAKYSKKTRTFVKGSGASAQGPYQTMRLREELGTFFANGSITCGTIATATTQALLNPILAGTAYNSRSGNKVLNKSVEVIYSLTPGATQTTYQNIRIILLYDKQPNGALFSATTFLNTDNPFGFLEPGFSDRFTILANMFHKVGPKDVDDKGVFENCYRGCSLQSTYDGEAGTIADIETGAIYLFVVGDTAVTSTTTPQFNYSSKIRYVK